jgi:hypothetical protein
MTKYFKDANFIYTMFKCKGLEKSHNVCCGIESMNKEYFYENKKAENLAQFLCNVQDFFNNESYQGRFIIPGTVIYYKS